MAKLSVPKALLKAKSHSKKGETAEAIALYERILEAFPKNREARDALKNLSPASSENNKSVLIDRLLNLYLQGQLSQVITEANSLIERDSNEPAYWNLLGAAHKGFGNNESAYEAFSEVTKLDPNNWDGHSNQGAVLADLGQHQPAVDAYQRALALNPKNAVTHNNLGVSLNALGQADEAIAAYANAIALNPDYAEAFNNLGTCFHDQGRELEAIEAYETTVSLQPDHSHAHYNLGTLLRQQGRLTDAIAALERAIASKSDHVYAYYTLSMLTTFEANDPKIAAVQNLLSKPDLTEDERFKLHYALAKINEDVGDTDAAFNHYVEGGALKQSLLSYHFSDDEELFERIKNTVIETARSSGPNSTTQLKRCPIFIVGMPRSGTTLVEQIVSSHSQAHGAGELPFLERQEAAIIEPGSMVDADSIRQLREGYSQDLEKVANNAPFVIDKLPHNFLRLALIAAAFPEAKIIHVHRDPAATCWSNFKHSFTGPSLGYSYKLEDTVAYYKLYKDLMCFWEEHLGGRIYHLNYEQLTSDQESQTRQLINSLGFEWEDACLSPHKNKRSVRTASTQQVRTAVYKNSSQAWRKFESNLQGVFDELYDAR
jgi:tetratricopeptide (TPR) repeat protein